MLHGFQYIRIIIFLYFFYLTTYLLYTYLRSYMRSDHFQILISKFFNSKLASHQHYAML